jgi:hypothetical protein
MIVDAMPRQRRRQHQINQMDMHSSEQNSDDHSPTDARIAALSCLIVTIIRRLDNKRHTFSNGLIEDVKADLAAAQDNGCTDQLVNDIFDHMLTILEQAQRSE